MKSAINFCALPGGRGGSFKYPKLSDLHIKLFGKAFADAHDAAYDVDATARCFFGLIQNNVIRPSEITDINDVKYEAPQLAEANFVDQQKDQKTEPTKLKVALNVSEELKNVPFTHLHNHSQFSILQSTTKIKGLIDKAVSLGMEAIALSDHGNMMATFHFVRDAIKSEIKPIVGCEFFLCHDRNDKSYQDNGFQTVLLAKNKNGYQNLIKLASYANIDGFYYVPRIDKELLLQYKDDLIALTGGIWGEVPNKIIFEGNKQAEEALIWWKDNFGDDFYIELNRHGVDEENVINKTLLEFAEKHQIKYVACNNTYYVEKEDAEPHDILLCIRDGNQQSQEKKYIGKRGREFRFGFPNNEFYIKSADEMKQLFADLPDAIINTQEIVDKIESFELAREVLLPKFDIPEEFKDDQDIENTNLKIGENNYLRHITYEGAKKRYGEKLTDEVKERIDFELSVIKNTGYPGYFLIVEDFIREARKMGVSVGPGRGSAAGAVVAYCTWITNINPLEYDLLFERFLNPDRISMPDIDIDFDDEGRAKVMDYVIKKYGSNQVAQIITYGTMAAKSSIRDTARVLELPLDEAGRLAGLIPNIKLNKIFEMSEDDLQKQLNRNEDFERAKQLKNIAKQDDLCGKTVKQAILVEGSMRNVGIHACGVIITPDDITNYVPVALAKDSNMTCTQFDNSVAEDAGLLKMDFLGLKTLTLIKDAVQIVKDKHGIELDPETFDIQDEKTYELFQKGETIGVFQYESPGMQKHLQQLKPNVFPDLIAMNALYRPGPMAYIPSFIKRKHGEEVVVYDLPVMEEILERNLWGYSLSRASNVVITKISKFHKR